MSKAKITQAGIAIINKTIRFDSIALNPGDGSVEFKQGSTVVATLSSGMGEMRNGDIFNITGIFGYMDVTLDL